MRTTTLMRWIHLTTLALGLVATGCSATHVTSSMDSNPLKVVAERAADDYSVHWVDENNLEISDAWPIHSVFTIGYTKFCADLHYGSGQLKSEFYLWNSSLLGLLLIPQTIDTSDSFYGSLLKPRMREQMQEVLGWAGTSVEASTVTYGPR